MKVPMHITRISSGRIEDNGMLYASAYVLNDEKINLVEDDRIDVGKHLAKVSISTDDNNSLSRRLANSGLIGSIVLCEVATEIKKNQMTMRIVDFSDE